MISTDKKLKVAALIDLPRSAQAGGHVKCWERLARAASNARLPLDLTVYFSGEVLAEDWGENVHVRQLPPVFSTSLLKFLPYVPDHTDLAPFHPRLALELGKFDVIHTTDGFFAFAQTAERLSRLKKIPLVTSFHTDTPSYTRIFTRQTLERLFGKQSWLTRKLCDTIKIPEKEEAKKVKRLAEHVATCRYALVTRKEDEVFAEKILGRDKVKMLRLGVDRQNFGPHRYDRDGVLASYGIEPDRLIALFVGRLDVGKNIYTLIEAAEKIIAEGVPLHIITAGLGPAADDLKARLGDHVSVAGFVPPEELARLYASVDFLALTSEVEIRSMAGVEAMASGCPVLVSQKSGIAELFHHTPAMRVVESGTENWTQAIRTFASSETERDHMRAAAVSYGENYLAAWEDVLAQDLFAVWQKAYEACSAKES